MSGELMRADLEIVAGAAIEATAVMREIMQAYAITPDELTAPVDSLRGKLEAGDRDAIVAALPGLMVQLAKEAQIMPPEAGQQGPSQGGQSVA